jgi:hypothetical protein
MCSIDSELVVKLEPQIVTSYDNNIKKRKCVRVKIDVLSNHIPYGFEISNIKTKGNNNEVNMNEYKVTKIIPDSPADKVNLKKDDRIIEINGHVVANLSTSEIQFLIKESKRSYDGHLNILVGNFLFNYFLKFYQKLVYHSR